MKPTKKKPAVDIVDRPNLGLDDSSHSIQVDPKELADFHEGVSKDAEEIERDAKEHFRDIERGGRRVFKRPFRL